MDDDEGLARSIAVRLESSGFHCIPVNTFAEARHQLRMRAIDLVVADLAMPGGSGVALAQTFRAVAPVPFVFISGHVEAFAPQLLVMSDVIILGKPFESSELVAAVRRALDLPLETGACPVERS